MAALPEDLHCPREVPCTDLLTDPIGELTDNARWPKHLCSVRFLLISTVEWAHGSVEGVVSGALGGALAGAVIGVAQWLVLRRYMRVGPEWILATALGVAIGDALGALLTDAGMGIGTLLITGLATGLAVGLLQLGLVLRGRLLRASLWPLVVAIAWPVGWTVTWAFGIDVERSYYVFGASGALVFAAITSLAMLLILRGRSR